MPRQSQVPFALQLEIFRGSVAVRRGLITAERLRSSQWRRVFRDVYMDVSLPLTYRHRCEAAQLITPPSAVFTGWAAACLAGVAVPDPECPVQVVVPPGCKFGPVGFKVRRSLLPKNQVVPGSPLTTIPARTAWEIGSDPDLLTAVVGLDILLAHGYVRAEELNRWAAERPRSRAARAISLADGRAESPQETRARVRLVLAGLPAPVPQFKVFTSSGRFVARLDLAWPEHKLACEYDGEWHAAVEQFRADRARLNKLVDAGWTVLHLTSRDLRDPVWFARLVGQIRAALERS